MILRLLEHFGFSGFMDTFRLEKQHETVRTLEMSLGLYQETIKGFDGPWAFRGFPWRLAAVLGQAFPFRFVVAGSCRRHRFLKQSPGG